MALQRLDRTQWSYAGALGHVQAVTVARRAAEAAKLPPKPLAPHYHWGVSPDPARGWKADHGHCDALHDLGARACTPYDRQQPGHYRDHRHHLGAHTIHCPYPRRSAAQPLPTR